MLLFASLLTASLAHAQDIDANGCVDSYEGNGACVSPNATVALTSTIGASAQVDDYAYVGESISVGANVFVATRSTLGDRVASPSNPLVVGDGVVVGRRADIGADHSLGADTVIGRDVLAGDDLATGADAMVGYGSAIGNGVTLGANSVVGSQVTLGDHTELRANTVVARGVVTLDAPNSADGSVIGGILGPNVTVGVGADIAAGARIRKGATLQSNVLVGPSARIGRDVAIGQGATVMGTVNTGAIIGDGATISQDAVVLRTAEVCPNATVPTTTVVDVYPPEGCSTCTDTGNLIPVMTSNSGPVGTASASSEFNSQYAAYEAFTTSNANGGNPQSAWSNSGGSSGWLRYDFVQPTEVGRYELTASEGNQPFNDGGARDWTFEGSNDGTNWTVLDTQADIGWSNYETKSFPIAAPMTFSSYRINITDNNGRAYTYVAALAMFCE